MIHNDDTAAVSANARLPDRLRTLLVRVPLIILAVIAVEQFEPFWPFPLTRQLMQTQDVPVLLVSCALLLALAAWRVPPSFSKSAQRFAEWMPLNFVVAILAASLVVALGTRYVANYTPVSHDEIMATFDADIVASGKLLAPIAPEWRSLSWTLKPAFRLPVPGDVAWVSTYLPGNALLRGVMSRWLDTAIINALFVAVALLALLGSVRLLWPGRHEPQVITIVLAAASAQVLCMGMTPFAMSAHLMLNLIWLWLYLRNTKSSHVAAVATGFLATGLHQLIFHPLFVAPFVLEMVLGRRWKLAAFYSVSYAIIGMFWIVYWQLLLASHGTTGAAASSMGVSFFIQRVASMLSYFSMSGPDTMVQNLLRFAAWQHPLMLILLAPGMVLGWRAGGVLRALASGIVLTLATMLILLPYQDIGWGYRYVHGLIGNAALLCAFGWMRLTTDLGGAQRQAAWGVMAATTVAAVLILLPAHAKQMHTYISPFTRAQTAISGMTEGAVVIETISIDHGIELIRNDPYLRQRPLTFDIGIFDEALVRELCTRMSVTVFDGKRAEGFGMTRTDPTKHPDYDRISRLRQLMESAECRELRRGG